MKDVPVPVTAVPARAIVPAPAVEVDDENVTAALLMILSRPSVSRGTAVTAAVGCTVPSKTRISSAAGEVRAGFQLAASVHAPEATFHVYVAASGASSSTGCSAAFAVAGKLRNSFTESINDRPAAFVLAAVMVRHMAPMTANKPMRPINLLDGVLPFNIITSPDRTISNGQNETSNPGFIHRRVGKESDCIYKFCA